MNLSIDRDINAGINIKRVGLGLFPTIKRRKPNAVVVKSTPNTVGKSQKQLSEIINKIDGVNYPH